MNETSYYYISDLKIVGKQEDCIPYIYQDGVWVVDNDNKLMDRLMGYNGDDIGCTDMLLRAEEITETQAEKLINKS